MRKIRAVTYAMLGSFVTYNFWQQGQPGLGGLLAVFTVAFIVLTLAPIGRMTIRWDDAGITRAVFPKKPRLIPWGDLKDLSSDYLDYHIKFQGGGFKIRKKLMSEDLLRRIKEQLKRNKARYRD